MEEKAAIKKLDIAPQVNLLTGNKILKKTSPACLFFVLMTIFIKEKGVPKTLNLFMKNGLYKNASFIFIIGITSLYIVSVLINLGQLNLAGEEPKRAIVSIEMMKSGDYMVPHTLGMLYYNKPPIFNWILAGIMSLTGSQSEFVLRLPSLITLLLWALVHYHVCKRYFSKKIALLSTFFLLTSGEVFFFALSNGTEIDIFYSFIVYLQAISLFWFSQKNKWWSFFIFSWLFCAVGFLTKGFPSIVFQGLTMAAVCLQTRSIKILFKPQQFVGLALFIFIVGSYFYAYSLSQSPSAMFMNLIIESVKKTGVARESAGKLHKVLLYPLSVLKLLLPWSLLLLLLFKKQRFSIFHNPLVKFSFLFLVFNIWVYWLTGVPELRYIYMFIPFVMNILVHLYEQFEKQHPGKINAYLKYTAVIFFIVLIGIIALPFFYKLILWHVVIIAALFVVFLYIFLQYRNYRIWIFIAGIMLLRLTYAVIGIPVQMKGQIDYRNSMVRFAQKNNNQPLSFWMAVDTINMDVVLAGKKMYKWKKEPVVIPSYLFFQIPYYYYRATGLVMKFDTTAVANKSYIAYKERLKKSDIKPFYAEYDRRQKDTLCLFRLSSGSFNISP